MKKIIEKLNENNLTISTMESCTGGYIVNEITNIEGASNVLKYSCITYSNEYKIKMGVSKEILDKYTVYSKEASNEMSKSISLFSNSDYGVGITGKLNRVDEFNPYGNNNIVYISIYEKNNNKFYNGIVECTKNNRKENKLIVLNKVKEMLIQILNSID